MRTILVSILLILLACMFMCDTTSQNSIPAFPSAEGFGAFSQGGRGGKIYRITTLQDYSPDEAVIEGSLREAIEAEGPRTIVFTVGGIITLKAPLSIQNPFITIAGQTAPGDGICLRDYEVSIDTHDVIIRYLRFRLGDHARLEQDALSIHPCERVIIDHCSTSWSIDEVLSAYGSSITIQWCIISEPLHHSFHPKGPHGLASILDGQHGGITIHHSIYAHADGRNPKAQNKDDAPGAIFDFRNNIIYDWGEGSIGYSTGEDRVRMNYVANYLKAGPSTKSDIQGYAFRPGGGGNTRVYLKDNIHLNNPEGTEDNRLLLDLVGYVGKKNIATGTNEPESTNKQDHLDRDSAYKMVVEDNSFPFAPVHTESAEEAYKRILSEAGTTLPVRDKIDKRIVEEIKNGTGRIIHSQDEVGGWPNYENAVHFQDKDIDGMDDAWEDSFGLDSTNGDDQSNDNDGDGYTNIEEFLNSTNPNEPDESIINCKEYKSVMKRLNALNKKAQVQIDEEKQKKIEALANRPIPEIQVEVTPEPDFKSKFVQLSVEDNVIIKLNLVENGTFLMGSLPGEVERGDDELQHTVTISKPYYMAETEVTNQLFRFVTKNESYADNKIPVLASWYDADWFCKILSERTGYSFRLPTEAEWEYACRAGTTTPFSTGEMISSSQANFNGQYTYGDSKPGPFFGKRRDVGQYEPNAWGLYDMHGNAYEWCLDWYCGIYSGDPMTDPVGSKENIVTLFDNKPRRVMRGGNYGSSPAYIRSAARYHYTPDVPYGFRFIMESK